MKSIVTNAHKSRQHESSDVPNDQKTIATSNSDFTSAVCTEKQLEFTHTLVRFAEYVHHGIRHARSVAFWSEVSKIWRDEAEATHSERSSPDELSSKVEIDLSTLLLKARVNHPILNLWKKSQMRALWTSNINSLSRREDQQRFEDLLQLLRVVQYFQRCPCHLDLGSFLQRVLILAARSHERDYHLSPIKLMTLLTNLTQYQNYRQTFRLTRYKDLMIR